MAIQFLKLTGKNFYYVLYTGKLMMLHILHTASGCIIALALFGKAGLHYYLDYLHNRSIGLSSIVLTPLQYVVPYKAAVNNKYQKLKYFCNLLLAVAAASLLLNIILGLWMYLM